jgi:hypothetical protein
VHWNNILETKCVDWDILETNCVDWDNILEQTVWTGITS